MEENEKEAALESEISRLTILVHDLIFRLVCSSRLTEDAKEQQGETEVNPPVGVVELYNLLLTLCSGSLAVKDIERAKTEFLTRQQMEKENQKLASSLEIALQEKEITTKELHGMRRKYNDLIFAKSSDDRATERQSSAGRGRLSSSEEIEKGNDDNDMSSSEKVLEQHGEEDRIVVLFSGFKEFDPTFNKKFKRKLIKSVTSLGGRVVTELMSRKEKKPVHFTHCVAPKSARTMKTVAARLLGAWNVTPDWVLNSLSRGEWIGESPFTGAIPDGNVLKGKRFAFDESFKREDAEILENALILIEQIGNGILVDDDSEEVDYILVGSQHSKISTESRYLTWNDLLEEIQSMEETKTKKRKRKGRLEGDEVIIVDSNRKRARKRR